MWEAYVVLTERPQAPENRARQHPLKGKDLGNRQVQGKSLVQWQYEVTSGARIWYCPDPDEMIVWVVDVHPGHPKATDKR
jgi:hypothetical protein